MSTSHKIFNVVWTLKKQGYRRRNREHVVYADSTLEKIGMRARADLFPENVYLDAVKEAYPSIQMPINFTEEEKKIQCIAKRVKAAFERMGNEFEKWRPARVLLDGIQEKPDILTKGTLAKFESIFKEVNKRLK